MNKFIVTDKKEIFFKNILIGDEKIMASDENYGSESAFREKVESGKVGKLDTVVTISYAEIDKIILFEDQNIIQIFYGKGKSGFDLGNASNYQEVRDFLLSKKNFSETKEQVNSTGAVIKPVLYTLVVALFSASLVFMAKELESGNAVTISGSRRGFKKILLTLAENLGFWGCLSVGVIATLGFAYYAVSQFKNSKTEVTVYK